MLDAGLVLLYQTQLMAEDATRKALEAQAQPNKRAKSTKPILSPEERMVARRLGVDPREVLAAKTKKR